MIPPKIAIRFLRWFCREDYVEEIEGDLTEIFEKDAVSSRVLARWKFTWQVVKHFRPAFIKSFQPKRSPINFYMIQHILLISFRNFLRHKQVFLINLLGLATGLTSVLLIYLWVQDEISIDQFHTAKDRLYQVRRHTPGPDKLLETHESNSVLLPEVLKKELPEVEYVVPMRGTDYATVSAGGLRVEALGAYAGEDFFKAFSFPLIHGEAGSALTSKYNMAISSDLAMKLFGSLDKCIGKSINWDLPHFGGDFVVSAIFEKPSHTSEGFDFLMTYEMFLEKNRMDVNWDSNPITVDLTLREGVDVVDFDKKLQKLYVSKRFVDQKSNGDKMFIQKYSDLYLHNHYENGVLTGGRIDYVVMFSVVAAFILVIACINFMNLSTARAQSRMKEIGIKKGIGAQRSSIILQHLGESVMISLFALFVSVIAVILLLPQFNEIAGKHLILRDFSQLIVPSLIVALTTGLLAGSYPALYLSGFKPVEILKGKFSSTKQEALVRRGLVVFQFVISIVLIVSVIVVYRQLEYIQSRDLGYRKENVILIKQQGELNTHLDTFLERARGIPGVLNASSIAFDITNNTNASWGHDWEGQMPGGENVEFGGANVNYGFIETLGIEVKNGRSFSEKFSGEDSKVMINETAMKAMGLKDPVGKWFDLFGTKREIIGVVKDYHFQSLYSAIRPQFMLLSSWGKGSILLRVSNGANSATIEQVKALCKEFNPNIAFEYTFLDNKYEALYTQEQRVSKLSQYFACIAVVLSCLGLFGLATFSAERRTKEFSIRKVLGCSEWTIMRMLSVEFISMVVIAALLALPLSWYYSQKWLGSFAYRSDLPLWLFVATAFVALLIALLTIAMQSFKAARVNPAVSLKSE